VSQAHALTPLPHESRHGDHAGSGFQPDPGAHRDGMPTADIMELPTHEPRVDTVEMDAEIAADWELWSQQIGRALLPVLDRLAVSTPTLTSAMICTVDGFNLCSLGLEERAMIRVAAMTSSLNAVADSVTHVVPQNTPHPLELVSLIHGTSVTVVLRVGNLILGQLLVWATADHDTTAGLLVPLRLAAESIHELLGEA